MIWVDTFSWNLGEPTSQRKWPTATDREKQGQNTTDGECSIGRKRKLTLPPSPLSGADVSAGKITLISAALERNLWVGLRVPFGLCLQAVKHPGENPFSLCGFLSCIICEMILKRQIQQIATLVCLFSETLDVPS